MSGTIEGGMKANTTNIKRYGEDYYKTIGAKGGAKRNPNKGFASDRVRARKAGAKGGRISKRTKKDTTN